MPWQIRTYNEVGKQHEFKAGDRIYMQPKKAHARHAVVHRPSRPNPVADLPNARHPDPALAEKQPRARFSALRPGMKLSLQWPLTKEGKLPTRAMGAQCGGFESGLPARA